MGELHEQGLPQRAARLHRRGRQVVVLTTVRLEGETVESADVLTYNGDGKLVAFDTLADETAPNRVFAK